MSKQYDLAVFIGRFQIFHQGHMTVLNRALELADKVLILIGSSGGPRTFRNPFTFFERVTMIQNSYPIDYDRFIFEPLTDFMYNDELWIKQVTQLVEQRSDKTSKICLIGYSKDHTSYYLNLFPQWDSVNVEQQFPYNSTNLRLDYFLEGFISGVEWPVANFLSNFKETTYFRRIQDEYAFVNSYKSQWASAPYPPIFVTTDACVIQSGHVLLVRRRSTPGKGLWALPGGFLNATEETIEQGTLRELKEETGIKVPIPVLRGSILETRVFDHPHRSARGRTITHASLIHLPPGPLPKVRGADDADKAKWFTLSEITRDMMFEDHYDIITYFANKL